MGFHGMRREDLNEGQLQSQSSWVPVTPAKPTPARPQLDHVERQGNPLVQTYCFQSVGVPTGYMQQPSSTEGVMCFSPMGSMEENTSLHNRQGALSGKNRAANHIVGSSGQSLTDTAAGWNNLTFIDLLAMTNEASASSGTAIPQNVNMATSSIYPPSYYAINNGCTVQNKRSFIENKDRSAHSNPWSNKYPSRLTTYGFPVPYQPTRELNSTPQTIAVAATNSTISFQHTQVADQTQEKQNNQLSELVDLVGDKRSLREKDKQEDTVAPTGTEVIMLQCDEHSSQPAVESSSTAIFTSMEEVSNCQKEGDHGTDLNKTPPQKPRRKKHRPKVITEGKAKRTPKPLTPKCTDSKGKSGKRKYVRRNNLKTSATPSTDAIDGRINPIPVPAVKSCKRTLNFDLERQNGEEDHAIKASYQKWLQDSIFNRSSCSSVYYLNSESDKSCPKVTTVDQGQGTEIVVEKTQADRQASIAYGPNPSEFQILTDYASLRENHAAKKPQCMMKSTSTENVKVLAMDTNDGTADASCCIDNKEDGCRATYQQFHVMGSGQVALPEKAAIKNHQGGVNLKRGPHKRQTKKNDPNCRNNKHLSMVKQTRGSKREYCHTTDQTEYSCTTPCWSQGIEETRLAERHIHTMNPAEAHNFWESYHKRTHVNGGHNHGSNFAPHISDMYKKQRTEQENITSASAMLSSISTLEDCSSQATECSGNHANKSYCESQVITCGIPASHFYTVSIPKKLNNAISEPKHDLNAFSVTSTCNSAKTKSSLGLISCIEAESCSAPGNLQLSQYLLTLDHTNSMTKKKFKGFTQACNLAPPITAEYNQLPQNSPKQTQVYSPRQRNEIFHRPQACMEALIADNTAKMTTDEHRNEPSQVSSVFRSSADEVHLQENEKFNCEYTQSSKFMESSRNPFDLLINSNYDHLSNSNGLCEAGTKEVTGKNMVPMDEVIQRLKLLDLSGGNNISHENYNALVPYGRKGTMVPYEGPFYPTRKRRQRPKVDLDPETNRLWKLLMGKEGSEGTDKDKEKWWEDERQVLQQRAELFIARMHLVQGDRRFSQWKGSVVDSVIGVFLTQNVSDHLSSSAFMSLAARFPLNSTGNHRTSNEEISTSSTLVKDPEVSIPDSEEFMLNQQVYDQCSMTLQETNHMEESEVVNSQESFGSNMGSLNTEISKCKQLVLRESKLKRSNELQGKTDTFTVGTGITSLVEPEDRSVEDAASSQDFEDSLVVQTTERNGSCSDSNSEGEDQTIVCKTKHIDGSTSFMELLQMAGTSTFKEIYTYGTWNLSHNDSSSNEPKQSEYMSYVQHQPSSNSLHLVTNSSAFIHLSNSQQPKKQVQIIPSENYCLNTTPDLGRLELKFLDVRREENRSLPPSMSNIIKLNGSINNQNELAGETTSESISQERVPSRAQEAPSVDPSASLKRHHIYPLCSSQPDGKAEINLNSDTNHEEEMNNAFHLEGIQFGESSQNSRMQQASNLPIFSGKCLEIESGTLFDKNKPVESNTEGQAYQSGTTLSWVNTNNQVKGKVAQKKNNGFDWDSLRREVYANGKKQEKCVDAMDSVDWEAVRCADVNEISNAIRERGMNNMLAERIKDFLNRLAREHGSIDLEWLMDIPPQNAKEYLLSVWGLGLKSVECVRLLRLHHIAFPVDTNVGRIAVRLGWVPLQPLPESLQLHLLELYPMLEAVQKYLWPRLCTLDQRTLYELHYQMITFGKVFCTKNKPNCNACPMRTECKHFASAFASARLALPGPEEKSIVSSNVPIVAEQEAVPGTIPMPLPLLEAEPLTEARPEIEICEPIIEVPATPEPESTEITLGDIEDAFYEDPDEIPTIKLNVEEFTLNLQNYMQENNMGLQEHDLSKALVALTPEATSIPMPKLKNVSRLRTEHQVYELPDSHPLLKGLDRREPGDPCSYLLAIWLPGETANSIQPPKNICDSQVSGQLCNEKTCFSCNSIREENSKTVRGTLLIPCRTALRGSFPLNGTYFQVNEVFADHESSLNPIYIPREWIWNLPRRTVYFGTSVTSIFKGLSTEEIQYCFWRGRASKRGRDEDSRPYPVRSKGFVCVRGFEQKTRAPRPLIARLHVAASKLAKSKT